jgi:hypothetical protein
MFRRLLPVVGAGALAAAGAAWAVASESHSVEVSLTEPTTVCGKAVPAGDYHFSWTEEGADTVGVTVERGRKVVTEVRAKVKERAEASPNEAVVVKAATPGTQILEEVRLRGDKTVLVFPAS